MSKARGLFSVLVLLAFLLVSNAFAASQIEIKTVGKDGYLLYLDQKPFLIKGVSYNPTPIGQGYNYDFFSDPNKPWLVDGKLMKEAGINCVRIYSPGKDLEKTKEFVRDMYEKFGIYTLMSDWLGLWDHPSANYADSEFRQRTSERVLGVVRALKDEPGLLMWILGNENNFTFSGKIGFWTSEEIEQIKEPRKRQIRKAEIYYSFVNDLTKSIKEIDPLHPVALGNGEDGFLKAAAENCQDIDALAIIIYRGKRFGNLFNNIRNCFDKPIVISEFGCDSYNAYKLFHDQEIQSEFLLAQWQDLYSNTAYSGKESGNALGGVIFEWSDEWWKYNESYQEGWAKHNTEADWSGGAYYYDIRATDNLNMNEEWFGLVELSEEIVEGINKRLPKKSYYDLTSYLAGLKFKHPNK